MKIAVTGSNGGVGNRVVALALKRNHYVVGIDITSKPDLRHDHFEFKQVDVFNYEDVEEALKGCEGVVHLAAIPDPGDYKVKTHNANVVMSWNVLRASAQLGIRRVVQASSVNVLALYFAQAHTFKYFPIDENHPCLPDEPYGLSKVICEIQADAIARRYPSMRIASLRLHWSVPDRTVALARGESGSKNDLWSYVQRDSAADAFLIAITDKSGRWSGHEAFYIVAPTTAAGRDSEELRQKYWSDVPVKQGKEISGKSAFFDCSKAEKLLGWVHRDGVDE
ncbi:hypothetical protein AX15_002012 [Amanita polypyramis BW_CC]|nr:hypothetical protein AX15_002012 [Amanita polypyramis BW_CC]